MFSTYHLVGNVSAGYLHHTLSLANSICSQLIEQFAQQLSTIGHQCAGILMYIVDPGVARSCARGKKKLQRDAVFYCWWYMGVSECCQRATKGVIFLIINALHISLRRSDCWLPSSDLSWSMFSNSPLEEAGGGKQRGRRADQRKSSAKQSDSNVCHPSVVTDRCRPPAQADCQGQVMTVTVGRQVWEVTVFQTLTDHMQKRRKSKEKKGKKKHGDR